MEMQGSNIFFTNGEEDPWQWATMREFKDPAKAKASNMNTRIIQCADCGHCVDLHTPTDNDPENLTKVRSEIEAEISKWLNPTSKPLSFLQL